MSGFSIEQLKFDPAGADDTHNVGAYVRSSDGTLITHHTKGNAFASVVYGGITFTANFAGTAGNSIALVFDGIDTVATVVGAWNAANPSNTVAYTGLGTVVPAAGTAQLAGGTDSQGLDVWLLNPSIEVTANNLDIRDLVFATDKVDVSGSTNIGLDAASLAALESITVQNGAGAAAVNIQDGGNSITVDGTVELGATTLAALETITVEQGTSPWIVQDAASYLEDSAHVSGNRGVFSLAVRNDTEGSLVSADGDYAPLQVDSLGRLRVNADISVVWDAINTTFPSNTSELYSYTLNSVLVQTILVHYENTFKKIIVNIEKTRF